MELKTRSRMRMASFQTFMRYVGFVAIEERVRYFAPTGVIFIF